ncbi:MAG: glycosyltransferase family 2 protein [Chitinophagia bacterium]|nr:glycosyltransferase family 2 protein [Chitinophagia bacterium]
MKSSNAMITASLSPAITVVILAFNESIHLRRAIDSAKGLTDDIVVVDSLSTDDTVQIARQCGAKVLERAWENNHSVQFNWAIDQLEQDPHWQAQWIFRLDADEIITASLCQEIERTLASAEKNIVGYDCQRSIVFMGHLLRYGGMSRNRVLRLYRRGHGYSESRWMDEHIVIDGPCGHLSGAVIDNNLNNLTWWTAKHNTYASRAAIDYLIRKYGSKGREAHSLTQFPQNNNLKDRLYRLLPLGLRGLIFFIYRYIFLLGFLDGKVGAYFYFLQTWWYRTLVDAKITEVEQCMQKQGADYKAAIFLTLGIAI